MRLDGVACFARARTAFLMRATGSTAACAVAATLCVQAAALAQPAARPPDYDSRYTSSAPKSCRVLERFKVGGAVYASVRVCKGIGGFVAVVSEDDLRNTVSFGIDPHAAMREPAAAQGFGPFNAAHETLEWRSRKGDAKPFAVIQRWTIADNDDPDPRTQRPRSVALLIVTRLAPGPVCHVAYVDAAANPDRNALARQAADTVARDFKCGEDKTHVMGKRGRGVELAQTTRH